MGLDVKRISQRRQTIVAERREQLVACAEAVANLATHREIKPMLAGHVKHDLAIRQILDTIVRCWTTTPRFISAGAARSGAKRPKDHVVPVRVLVDRMIMNPSECRVLLDTAVILATITPEEHRKLGGIFTHFEELYGRMLVADVLQLPELGHERYFIKKIKLQPMFRRSGRV